jgi:ABC-type amino acid transport substrate-binding protein
MRILGAALALALTLLAGAALAQGRCADVVPHGRPQNTPREFVGQDLDQITERGFVEFAVYENFPPYSWEEGGTPRGIDIEVGRLIAADLGVEPRFRFVQAGETVEADLMNYVWRGAVVGGRVSNVMLHVPYNSDFACRVEQVVFTGQYYTERIAIAYRTEDYPDGGPVPAYFRFDTVAVENDSISDFYLSSFAGGQMRANVRRYPTTAAAMAALAAGETKAAMGPLAQLEHGAGEGVAVHIPPLPGLAVGRWTLGVAVHHSHRDVSYAVDYAIETALADGRIAAIFESYGLSFTAPER